MAKKNISRKSAKNLRIDKNNTIKRNTTSLKKRLKLSHPNKSKLPKKKSRKNILNQEKIIKNFFDAQASVKIQCCICYNNLCNQIKIILEPMSLKCNYYQKDLFFNALCINCFILKTTYDSKNKTYFVENEFTLIKYNFKEYRILAKMSEPLFTEDWSLGDEIKLLGAVEKLGIENWEEISKIINKGIYECKSHYYTFYYKDKNDYLINEKETNINGKSNDIFIENKIKENIFLSDLTQNIGYIPFSENDNKSKCFLNKNNNNKNEEKKRVINKNMYNNLGYWWKRNEFDIEYKNDAEILLSELEFKDYDNYEAYNMNYKILQNYNNILDEREERKKLICNQNLFDIKKQINFDKKLSNEDREIYTNLKYNVRYLTKEQFSFIYESNVLQKNIKALLNQLYMYQNLGCKTYEDIQNYINKIKKGNLNEEEKIN